MEKKRTKTVQVGSLCESKNKPGEHYIKVTENLKVAKGGYLNFLYKPTEDSIANAVSEAQANFLTKKAEKWPDFLIAEVTMNVPVEE